MQHSTRSNRRGACKLARLASVALAVFGCSHKEATPAQPKPGGPQVTVVKGSATRIPDHVDAALFRRLREITTACAVNNQTSTVDCKRGEWKELSETFASGTLARAKALDTVLFAFEWNDSTLATVTANYLESTLSGAPPRGEAAPSKQTAEALIAMLGRLPEEQAADAAPAVVHAAVGAELETELFATVDEHANRRLPVIAYRHLLETGAMRLFPRVQELARGEDLEVALSAIDAARRMPAGTPEQKTAVCDWLQGITHDQRPMVALRASTFVVSCGERFFEVALVADEEKVEQKRGVTAAALHRYIQSCAPTAVRAGAQSASQCQRLETMLKAIESNSAFDEPARAKAREILDARFVKS